MRSRDVPAGEAAADDPVALAAALAVADCARAAEAPRAGGAGPMPDSFTYTLEVHDAAGAVHSWQLGEGDVPDSLLALDSLLAD